MTPRPPPPSLVCIMDHKASAFGSLRILTGGKNRAHEAEGAGLDALRGTSCGSLVVPGWHLHVSACGQKGLNSTRNSLIWAPHGCTALLSPGYCLGFQPDVWFCALEVCISYEAFFVFHSKPNLYV